MRRTSLLVALAAALVGTPASASASLTDGAHHQILNRQDPRCLDVDGAAGYNGAEVRVWRCVNAGNQRWQYIPWYEPYHDGWDHDPDGYKLRVLHTGKCLSVQWTSWSEGSNVVQDSCAEATYWSARELGGGWSRIVAHHGYLQEWCLDKSWSDVTVWSCHDGWWQQWQALG
jgi:hypothetical protein